MFAQRLHRVLLAVLLGLAVAPAAVMAFSFQEYEAQEQAEERARQERAKAAIQRNLATECPASAKHKRIVLLVSERHTHRHWYYPYYELDARHTSLFQHINNAFRKLGFRTYTQQQITDQIAKAEIEAVANGDVDAAVSAASRLGANYVLKANISSRSGYNTVVRVKEIAVDMNFQLQSASGDLVGATSAHAESYSGEDTLGVAHMIAREQANAVASRLYRDLCKYESAKAQ